jgi:3-hydroxybutyryl-CoA dehydrogenase
MSEAAQGGASPQGGAPASTAAAPVTPGASARVQRVVVVGGGIMGNGIAQVFATSGFDVLLVDARPEFIERALDTISRNLDRVAKKQEWSSERKAEIVRRISGGVDLSVARDCDLVIEAVSEDAALKKRIFETLDASAPARTVLASNTSSISITEIAAATKRADRVIGMHFMNPVPVMQLVEIIRGLATSDATYALTEDLARRLGKVPVEVNDAPGFIANRILMPMINEAAFALMEGVATREAIDTVMKLGMNHPMGPLALADLIGLDTCLSIMEMLHAGLGDSKYRPCPLLRKMVSAGWLGKKSGRGFYEYAGAPRA